LEGFMAGVKPIVNGIVHSVPVKQGAEVIEKAVDSAATQIKETVDEFTNSTVNNATTEEKKGFFQQIGHTISQFFSTFSKSVSDFFGGLKNFVSSLFGKAAAKEEAASTVEKEIAQPVTQQSQQEIEEEAATTVQNTTDEGVKDIATKDAVTDSVAQGSNEATDEAAKQTVTQDIKPPPITEPAQAASKQAAPTSKAFIPPQTKDTVDTSAEEASKKAGTQTTQDAAAAAEPQAVEAEIPSSNLSTRKLMERAGVEPEFIEEVVQNEEKAAAQASAKTATEETETAAQADVKPSTEEAAAKETPPTEIAKETTTQEPIVNNEVTPEAAPTKDAPVKKGKSKKASKTQSKGMGWKAKWGAGLGVAAGAIGTGLYHSPEGRAVVSESAEGLKNLTTNLTNTGYAQWENNVAPMGEGYIATYGAKAWDKVSGLMPKGQSSIHVPGLDDQVFQPGASFLNGNETQYITVPHTPSIDTPIRQQISDGLGFVGNQVNQGAQRAWGALEQHAIPESHLNWKDQLDLAAQGQSGTAFSNAAAHFKPAKAAESSAKPAFELNDNVFLEPETVVPQGNETISNHTANLTASRPSLAKAAPIVSDAPAEASGISFPQFAKEAPGRFYKYATGDWTRTKNTYNGALELSKQGYQKAAPHIEQTYNNTQEWLQSAKGAFKRNPATTQTEAAAEQSGNARTLGDSAVSIYNDYVSPYASSARQKGQAGFNSALEYGTSAYGSVRNYNYKEQVVNTYNQFIGKSDIAKQALNGSSEAAERQFATSGNVARLAPKTQDANNAVSHNLSTTTAATNSTAQTSSTPLPIGKLSGANGSKTGTLEEASATHPTGKSSTPEPDIDGDTFYDFDAPETFPQQSEVASSTSQTNPLAKPSAASSQEELDKLFADLLGEAPKTTETSTLPTGASKTATPQTSSTANPLDEMFAPLLANAPKTKATGT
jgi:hypothetical protein